jgi:hypothetical protein
LIIRVAQADRQSTVSLLKPAFQSQLFGYSVEVDPASRSINPKVGHCTRLVAIKSVCHPDQIRKRPRTEFFHHVVAMHFRGGLSNPDFRGDLLVQPACAYQTHHLPLARGERVCNARADHGPSSRHRAWSDRDPAQFARHQEGLVRAPALKETRRRRPSWLSPTLGCRHGPVMNMIGMLVSVFDSSAWNSRPLSPGKRMSSTKQLTSSGSFAVKNSAVEPYALLLKPTDWNRLFKPSRTSRSSSTT